ncbi:MAG: hypothetical protein IJU66_07060 [Oscillospiraceae bacterium]|nr:hypothetical protein [Oscillospiraceae bacterium]
MKRFLILLAAALLTGCNARESADRAEAIQQKYAAMSGCTARVEVAVARADETLFYTLDLERDAEGTRLTVAAPELLAGVGVTVSGDDMQLRYDDLVLDALSADPEVSAVNASDIVLRAVANGAVTERGAEELDGRNVLRLCFETERGGETLRAAVWFDGTDAPLYAQIEGGGKILAEMRFTDFVFRDTIGSDLTTKRDGIDGYSPQTDMGGNRS